MGYVAIRGGEEAIEQAAGLLELLRVRGSADGEEPITLGQVSHQLHFLHGAVLSEGGLYDPELAALAIKQSLGDPLEAAFYLRAYRCTRPRLLHTPVLDSSRMRLIRRISAAFKDVPGGQMLGPTPDYTQRLFNLQLLEETSAEFQAVLTDWLTGLEDVDLEELPREFPKVVSFLRRQGLVDDRQPGNATPFDITRQPLVFPVPRSAVLGVTTRAQQGSLLALAYSSMRGYGDIHPTVAELRVGYLPVHLPHPITGETVEIGEVLLTECEVISQYDRPSSNQNGQPQPATFGLGYGACFGHNEAKAISMAILDRALQKGMAQGPSHPSEDPEFVLLHIDGVDSMGFCVHYKMPHYVTFQSDLDRLRATQSQSPMREHSAEPNVTIHRSPS